MDIAVMEISPAIAADMLKRNASNRPIRQHHVNDLADAMKAGRFQTTHQGIAINADDFLVDGQHRLLAIIKSGCTVRMVVARGVNAEHYRMLMVDVGKNRNAADLYATDKQVTEPCSFLASLHANIKNKVFLAEYLDAFGPIVAALVESKKTRRACVTASPVVAAAAVRIALGADVGYVQRLYAGMVKLDYDALPPVANAYLRQVANGVINSHMQLDMFARAMAVFNVDAASNAKIQIKDVSVVVGQTREFITQFLAAPARMKGVHARAAVRELELTADIA